jgi:hypothetical protein
MCSRGRPPLSSLFNPKCSARRCRTRGPDHIPDRETSCPPAPSRSHCWRSSAGWCSTGCLSCPLNWVFFLVNLSCRFPIFVSIKTRSSVARSRASDVLASGKSLARRALFRAHRQGCFAAQKQRWNCRGALCYRTDGAPSRAQPRGPHDAATGKISCFPLSWSVPSLYPLAWTSLSPDAASKTASGLFFITCRHAQSGGP